MSMSDTVQVYSSIRLRDSKQLPDLAPSSSPWCRVLNLIMQAHCPGDIAELTWLSMAVGILLHCHVLLAACYPVHELSLLQGLQQPTPPSRHCTASRIRSGYRSSVWIWIPPLRSTGWTEARFSSFPLRRVLCVILNLLSHLMPSSSSKCFLFCTWVDHS